MSTLEDRVSTLNNQLSSALGKIEDLKHQVSKGQQRIIIFIDNTNLNYSTRKVEEGGNYRICYDKLVNTLSAGRCIVQTRIYYSDFEKNATLSNLQQSEDRKSRENFYNYLRFRGYFLKFLPLVGGQNGDDCPAKEKGLDAAIIRDMQRLCQASLCDTIVLVAGDADYKEMVVEAQDAYFKRVEVAFFDDCTSPRLKGAASQFINLKEIKESIRRDK